MKEAELSELRDALSDIRALPRVAGAQFVTEELEQQFRLLDSPGFVGRARPNA